jgi:hypothetical protein
VFETCEQGGLIVKLVSKLDQPAGVDVGWGYHLLDGDSNIEGQMPTAVDVGHPPAVHEGADTIPVLKNISCA